MTKGIVYTIWGNFDRSLLDRSIKSAEMHGYDYTVLEVDDIGLGLGNKVQTYDLSPYDITLYLDADTEIKGNLDFGFDMAKENEIACCIAPAESAYLAKPNTIKDIMHRDLPQYNTGVIFFKKCFGSSATFNRWWQLLEENPASKHNDQPYFSQAVYENLNPYILPNIWNYRAKIRYEKRVNHGPVKILHSK